MQLGQALSSRRALQHLNLAAAARRCGGDGDGGGVGRMIRDYIPPKRREKHVLNEKFKIPNVTST